MPEPHSAPSSDLSHLAGGHGPLERQPLLDQAECSRVVSDVLALRERWFERSGVAPFFTLGAAAYLDAAVSPEAYRSGWQELNPVLRARFGWLLDRTGEAIAQATGLETAWLEGSALPGFHIYLASSIFSLPVASVHFDRQYELVDWSGIADPDFSTPLSFTLPVQLPEAGGGLNTWAVQQDEIERMKAAGVNPPMTYVPYRAGELVMHSGNLLHQVAPSRKMIEGDRRITLQGHGIRAGGRIYLYW